MWARALMALTGALVVVAASEVAGATIAESKGLGGSHAGGAATSPAPSSGATSPPGWSSPGQRDGWNGATTPPGWERDNAQRSGWGDALVPPGFDNGYKNGWDTSVTPVPTKP